MRAFRFALDIDLPILPATIAGIKDILHKNAIDLFPGKAGMTIHEPIDVRGYDVKTIDKLIRLTRKRFHKAHKTDRKGRIMKTKKSILTR